MATDYTNPEMIGLERQRALAKALLQQGMETPQGQMISNRYVPVNPLEFLGNLGQVYAGNKLSEQADAKQIEYAKKLREQEGIDLARFAELQYGSQGQAGVPELTQQGPTQMGGNIPVQPAMPAIPGVAADPMSAYQFAAKSQSPLVRAQLAEMLKGQKLGEGEVYQRYNPSTGKMEVTGQGAPKYHAPISIDTGNSTILLDPMTKQKIAEYPKAHQPVAGQIFEGENGPMLIDTRTGQAKPIMAGGQPLAGGKPLTESQGNATAFGIRMKESNSILNDLEKKGVTNTGVTRSVVSGVAGMTPFMGEKLQQGVSSAMNVLPGALGGPSAEQQQVDAARKNFVTAVLRKESGAAISPSEFYTESQKYFPQVGDSAEVIKQKSHARETAIKAMEIQAGTAGTKKIEQFGNQAPQTPMYATNGQTRIISIDGGKTWQPAGGK